MNSSKPVASSQAGYAGKKRRTNLSLNKDLVKAAQMFLPSTAHGSLSSFVEDTLEKLLRKNVGKLRAAGIAVPPEIFEK